DDVADGAGEERIVRAAEEKGVDARVDERPEPVTHDRVGPRAAEVALFDELDETGAGDRQQLDGRTQRLRGALVRAGADSADSADHRDPTVAGHLDCGAQARVDDA